MAKVMDDRSMNCPTCHTPMLHMGWRNQPGKSERKDWDCFAYSAWKCLVCRHVWHDPLDGRAMQDCGYSE